MKKSKCEDDEKCEGSSSKLCNLIKGISVEPALFLTIFSRVLYDLTTQTFLLERTCRNQFEYNSTVCDSMIMQDPSGYDEAQEVEVQKFVSKMYTISSVIQGVSSVVLMLFLGSWSDKYDKRKPLILAPIFGELVGLFSLIINTIYEDIPVVVTTLMVYVPPALAGGWPCLFLGAYSYINSKSSVENKTVRIGCCSAVCNVAFVLGASSSGFLLWYLGYLTVFCIGWVLTFIAFLYIIFRIQDPSSDNNRKPLETWNIFRLEYPVKTLKSFLKGRSKGKRLRLIIIIVASALVIGVIQGEYFVLYFYTRLKFDWTEVDFSIFTLLHSLVDITGSCFSLLFLSTYMRWKDTSLGMLSVCCTMCGTLIYSLAPTDTIFYAGIIFDAFSDTTGTALRSILMKLVPENELGQIYSIFEICEACIPAIFGSVYLTVYKSTIAYFPSAFYFISITMYLIGISLFTWLHFQQKAEEKFNELEQMERMTCLNPDVKKP